jgi:FKBP-type peptidyl-prolyl cis-trans isomerase
MLGCEDPLANTAISQEEKIDKFIESKYQDSTIVSNQGVNRILLEAGDSTCFAAVGDVVDFQYIAYLFETSIGDPFAGGTYTARLGEGEMIKGLELGLEGMCPGEHSYIIFSCKYGYEKTVAGIGKDKALVFEVLMKDINPE